MSEKALFSLDNNVPNFMFRTLGTYNINQLAGIYDT